MPHVGQAAADGELVVPEAQAGRDGGGEARGHLVGEVVGLQCIVHAFAILQAGFKSGIIVESKIDEAPLGIVAAGQLEALEAHVIVVEQGEQAQIVGAADIVVCCIVEIGEFGAGLVTRHEHVGLQEIRSDLPVARLLGIEVGIEPLIEAHLTSLAHARRADAALVLGVELPAGQRRDGDAGAGAHA